MKRPRKPKPITAARVEAAIETLEWLMSKSRNAHMLVPQWKWFTSELERLRESESIIEAAKAKVAARMQNSATHPRFDTETHL